MASFKVGSFWSGAVYTMGTCHKGLLGNLGAKDGAFGKYLGPQKMRRNRTRKGLALKQDGWIWIYGDRWLGGGFPKDFWNFHPENWGNDPISLYNIFQLGWNHQLDLDS